MSTRTIISVRGVFALLVGACAVGGAYGQLSTDQFVISGEKAYGLLPPQPVSGSAESFSWSSDGAYLLVTRKDLVVSAPKVSQERPPFAATLREQSVLIYRVLDGKSTVVWRSSMPGLVVEDATWLAGAATALLTVTEPVRSLDPSAGKASRQQVIWLDARSGRSGVAVGVEQRGGEPFLSLRVSPLAPFGVIQTYSRIQSRGGGPAFSGSRYQLIDALGNVGEPLAVDPSFGSLDWSRDGKAIVLLRISRGADGRPVKERQAFEVPSGRALATVPPLATELAAGAPDLKVTRANETIAAATSKAEIRPIWLAGRSAGLALIAGDAQTVELAPGFGAVVYITQGVAIIRPIVRISTSELLVARQAEAQMKNMTDAKQVALALAMYSLDMEDKLPGKEGFAKEVMPYLRDASILDRFVYTFAGGSMSGKDSATTVLGYLNGAGGKAVLYADGHVVWQAGP